MLHTSNFYFIFMNNIATWYSWNFMYKTLLVLLLLLCYTKNVYLFPINHLVSQDCNGLTLQKRAHIYTYIPKKKKKKQSVVLMQRMRGWCCWSKEKICSNSLECKSKQGIGRTWCWERLKAAREGWESWIALWLQ